MSFCIDRRVLGSVDHLIITDENERIELDFVPNDVWHLSGELKSNNPRCLDTALRLEHTEMHLKPPERWAKMMSLLAPNAESIPWAHVLPPKDHTSFVEGLIDATKVTLGSLNTEYYTTTWVPSNRLFASMKRARIDPFGWDAACTSDPTNPRLRTFRPDAEGRCGHVSYDRFGTRTGRLTVDSGPNILTLDKVLKPRLFRASQPGWSVYQWDFNALEMRILLYETGFKCDEVDLYGMIRREFLPDVSRDVVKGAVIMNSYGQNHHVWGPRLGLPPEHSSIVDEVLRAHFNAAALQHRLKSSFIETSSIRNKYGRLLQIDDPRDFIVINSYAQSTGVDVSLHGFMSLLDRFGDAARPLFLLHDALIVEMEDSVVQATGGVVSVTVPGFEQPFYLKAERLQIDKDQK